MVISDEKIQVFSHIIKDFANRALRTICISYKNISKEQVDNWKEKDDQNYNKIEKDDFCLVGIFGIKDQLRDGVANAVDKCQIAGIKVVMVTGDNIDTANAIARDCHIITREIEDDAKENNKTISYVGKDFYEKIGGMRCDSCEQDLKFCSCPRSELQAEAIKTKRREQNPDYNEDIPLRKERIVNMDKFREIYEDIRVIARSRPEDKYTMVYGLRELGQVVAVTGDGTNDAPALSKSDVGFAMGISGTDIAKQAADIIILDDNFATIVQAVKWGRNIYDNIRKFIQFQLTVNICACLLVFISSCIGKETPLSAIQMLWVNLIMDSLGSLALATEPPNENLLTRKPYPKTEYIINSLMWKHIFYQAMFELFITLFFYLYAHRIFPETNPLNVKINQQLLDCYGYIPGQKELSFLQQDVNRMTAGPVIFWELETQKLADALPTKCGEFYNYPNLEEAHKLFIGKYGSVHLTVIFNTFVLYTLFNQLNARVIDDSYNIFADIHKNYLFLVIILVELGLQALIVSVAGIPFKVSVYGLDGPQWGICFAFGALTFLVCLILKPIPFEKCFDALYKCMQKMKGTEVEVKEEEVKKTNVGKVSVELSAQVQVARPKTNTHNLHVEEVRVSSKNSSGKNMAKADLRQNSKEDLRRDSHANLEHHGSNEVRKPNSVLLNLRRPSMNKQFTNRQQSKMRSIKE
jgi:Ca2+ transporting ATPase